MRECKWTEGPWAVSDIDHYGGYDCMTDAVHVGPVTLDCHKYGQICSGDQDYDKVKMLSDAHLIASAPRMYKALEQAVTSMLDSGYSKDDVVVRECVWAMNQARGESQ